MSNGRAVRKLDAVQPFRWWALVRSARALPIVFASRQDAVDNCEPDEFLVEVFVGSRESVPVEVWEAAKFKSPFTRASRGDRSGSTSNRSGSGTKEKPHEKH
jgi:hypothetical protein